MGTMTPKIHLRDSQSSNDGARLASLDGLRGISILSVMTAHAADRFNWTLAQNRAVHAVIADGAYLGVLTFFVISGFLITTLLMRE